MVAAANILDYRLQTSTPTPIDYLAGTAQGVELDKGNPMMIVELWLEGSLDVTVAAATLKDGGILNLIESIYIRVGGERNIFRYRGKVAQIITHLYERTAPYISQPAVTVGSNPFAARLLLPIDAFTPDTFGIADFRSLLDPSSFGTSPITLEIQWASSASVVATAGGGGTVGVSNVKVRPTVFHSRTKIGVAGGLGWGQYMLHLLTGDTKPVTATEERFELKLADNHVHQRVILMAEEDGVLSDSIINSIKTGAAETGYYLFDARRLQAQNMSRYRFTQLRTGIYVVDFAAFGHPEQMLTYSGSTEIRLWLDVTGPVAPAKRNITWIQDRFIRPG